MLLFTFLKHGTNARVNLRCCIVWSFSRLVLIVECSISMYIYIYFIIIYIYLSTNNMCNEHVVHCNPHDSWNSEVRKFNCWKKQTCEVYICFGKTTNKNINNPKKQIIHVIHDLHLPRLSLFSSCHKSSCFTRECFLLLRRFGVVHWQTQGANCFWHQPDAATRSVYAAYADGRWHDRNLSTPPSFSVSRFLTSAGSLVSLPKSQAMWLQFQLTSCMIPLDKHLTSITHDKPYLRRSQKNAKSKSGKFDVRGVEFIGHQFSNVMQTKNQCYHDMISSRGWSNIYYMRHGEATAALATVS